ncbi:DEAD/DEAH box helicase [Actinacidiphila oryziradicis]|uniref:DEAD/DEAH box helicase n=1 Tax=Actinacidiphila oryziradicis TaxID=2571141 RepID=A0A4U0SEW3_9ACTN|nr:DEAD/DEAH box helicase [Actinacidiphila oryziradicis]TKA08080.1 DEAD/DEAH box helicase [Actinacidiphila oryziradicis]
MPIDTADRSATPADDSIEIVESVSAATAESTADTAADATPEVVTDVVTDTADIAAGADSTTIDDAITEGADDITDETPDDAPSVTFGDLGLAEPIVRKLAQNGVTDPFPIQAATIPDALAGKDILGRGRTGSGKTLAFGLPLLTLLSGGHTERKHPRGVILTPTRELAMQVADALQPYGDVLGLKMKVVCGGTSMSNQIYALERGVDVLVATPGRLRDLMNRGAASLDQVQIAVLDEADQMADMGFLPEVTEILDQIPQGGQRLLFSATLENEIDSLVKRYLKDPVTHEVDAAQGAVTTMSHHVLVVKPKDKAPVTAAIASRKGRTIIFVRTQMGADRVAEQLIEAGVRADALHGGMTQGARTRTLEDFKDGHVNVLVATDVAARGIHVDGIGLVLNVDPAADHKDYLHRSGRTARAGESGTVVSLALPHQRKQIFRLMEDAGVDATRHIIGGGGAFDEDVSRITGARSLTDVQADAVQNAAQQAEREVADLNRQLERAQRRATELREEADRLTGRAARERGEDPDEAIAAKAAEAALAAEAAAAAVPAQAKQPAAEQRDRRDDRGSFDRRRDDRPSYNNRDRRDERPSYSRDRRDERPSYNSRDRRDDRPARPSSSSSYERRDDRPSYNSRDRRDERPAARPSSSSSSYQRRDDRPSYNSRDRRDERPAARPSSAAPSAAPASSSYERRDDRPSSYNRDHRPAGDRPFNRDRRDERPAARPAGHRTGTTGAGNIERKPRWKRNG